VNQSRTHDDAIADVLWWMKGALAFVHSSERGTIQRMHDKLLALREWQGRLGNEWNRVVRFDADDARAVAVIAITERELEILADAIKADSEKESSAGRELASAIFGQMAREMRSSEATEDLPF